MPMLSKRKKHPIKLKKILILVRWFILIMSWSLIAHWGTNTPPLNQMFKVKKPSVPVGMTPGPMKKPLGKNKLFQ